VANLQFYRVGTLQKKVFYNVGFACFTAVVVEIRHFLLTPYNIYPFNLSMVLIGHIPC